MANITSQFAQLLVPGLKSVIEGGYRQPPDEIDYYFIVEGTQRAFEEEYALTDLGMFIETPELGATSYDDRLPKWVQRFTPLKYTLGIALSEEMYEDDLYGIMRQYGTAMGRSGKTTPQVTAFSVFNRAFNTAYAGPDGQPLCSLTHTLYGGGTQANRPSTAADLNYTALAQAEVDMLNWTDDRGKLQSISPAVLLTAPAQKRKAYELTKSEYNPEGVERTANYIKSMGLASRWNPYLTSSKAWWVLAAKQYTHLRVFWRKKLGIKMWEDHDRGALRARGSYRMVAGFSDYMGVYGDAGL